MKVKCVICDQYLTLEDQSSLAKKLRNHPIHTFMCEECDERIKVKTKKRHRSGNFHLYHYHDDNNF